MKAIKIAIAELGISRTVDVELEFDAAAQNRMNQVENKVRELLLGLSYSLRTHTLPV